MADDPRERAEQRTLLMPRRDQGSELKPGHKLQEFVVERPLGVGGYSIVYLARDTRLDRRVALKEYLPATLAMRLSTNEVMPRLPRFQGQAPGEPVHPGYRIAPMNRSTTFGRERLLRKRRSFLGRRSPMPPSRTLRKSPTSALRKR